MWLNYIDVVNSCLNNGEYCLLHDQVKITIYYKLLLPNPDSLAKLVMDDAEKAYESSLDPVRYSFLMPDNKHGTLYLHTSDHIYTNDLKIFCVNIFFNQGALASLLKTSFTLFEEEIYTFIQYLNYDPTKVYTLLGITFDIATRFIPINLKMNVSTYSKHPLEHGSCTTPSAFGPCNVGSKEDTVLYAREFIGKISRAHVKRRILSLNDKLSYKHNLRSLHGLDPYVIYLAQDYNACFPLAFNPLENPIITELDDNDKHVEFPTCIRMSNR